MSNVKQCPGCGLVLAQVIAPPSREQSAESLARLAVFVNRYRAHNDELAKKLLTSNVGGRR